MEFRVVYYPEPVPSSFATLGILALVFDKVVFPGVHIPSTGIDRGGTAKELERIKNLPSRRIHADDYVMLRCMQYALNYEHVSDFCEFPGQPGKLGTLETGAPELMMVLEEQVYGPSPLGFTPMQPSGFLKGLPGIGEVDVNGPSWLGYSANAYLYAKRHGELLVTDRPGFPMPALPCDASAEMKRNVRGLATMLALESVRFALPNIRHLSFSEIAEFRAETHDFAVQFRRAMVKMSKDLSSVIESDSSLDDVREEARFLVETTVGPALEELREELSRPSRPWYRRIVSFAKDLPELVGAFTILPVGIAKSLAKFIEVLADVRDAQLERDGIQKRCDFHYLLKLESLKQ